jgi:methionyl aminopeptidase
LTVNSEVDVEGLFAAGRAVRAAFELMRSSAEPGITTAELDAIGESCLTQFGARSAPQLYYDFPGATCISVNEQAAHGIPSQRRLADGDMINIDVSAELNGYVADMGESFVVGTSTAAQRKLCEGVQTAVAAALERVRAGRSLNVIGRAVQQVADRLGFQVVENLGSHGVGRSIHEDPSYVPIDNPLEQRRLGAGQVLTIEPFFTTGASRVQQESDGWTLTVPSGDMVAQFEHTLIVTDSGPLVVTAPPAG